ncbi:unnamed protein product [Dracunculus medinensis]|uniref:Rab-GAP TBC domain-containing protein n=1 Tax=Dracunculus medinensis TaxID=318479 RepID=A0A158Q2Q5_DRAME|nr:unnamed protein product [Dracunculus medinensis]
MIDADLWSDPTADELVQRHRLHSSTSNSSSTSTRPPLSVLRGGSSIVSSTESYSPTLCSFGRDYIYSLHQNVKYSLLYGKNNVLVTVASDTDPLKGYLSLHQNSPGNVTVKWTPNQLMHSSSEPNSAAIDIPPHYDNNWLWRHTINININDIIYIHIHQQSEDSSPSLIFIGTDGVQHSPMHFPIGQHILAFLSCLESGLMPYNRLDPPLWISKEKGKILPKLRRRSSISMLDSTSNTEGQELHDYVFRIIPISVPTMNIFVQNTGNNSITDLVLDELVTVQESPKQFMDENKCASSMVARRTESDNTQDRTVRQKLNNACMSMKTQILARAFYGWKSYCCHLRTIRMHLSGLFINDRTVVKTTSEPVNEAFWSKCRSVKSEELERECLLRIYYNGIDGKASSILRKQIWPYLLGLLKWKEDLVDKLGILTAKYNDDIEKWKKIELIVQKKDKEALAAGYAELDSSNCDNEISHENDARFSKMSKKDNLIHEFGVNLHRVIKDVERCDRTFSFFAENDNLIKLKRVMCTYIWRNLKDGYIQGMCDLAAPLLVLFNDEALTLACFDRLMLKMKLNFPQNTGMDDNLANMRSLIQVIDPQLYEFMSTNGDFTHLYFCYRWFLLDFKREFTYSQIFNVWEVIWAVSSLITPHFQLFIALALISNYRRVIIDNKMDFTDVIKFFNEMAEHHNVDEVLDSARNLLERLQNIIYELNEKS